MHRSEVAEGRLGVGPVGLVGPPHRGPLSRGGAVTLPFAAEREIKEAAQWQGYQADKRPGLTVQAAYFLGARDVDQAADLEDRTTAITVITAVIAKTSVTGSSQSQGSAGLRVEDRCPRPAEVAGERGRAETRKTRASRAISVPLTAPPS